MDSVRIESVKKRLAQIEEERKVLNRFLEAWDELLKLDGVGQLPLNLEATTKNGTNGKISFPNGLRQVLQRANGKPMKAADIWKQMQALGVVSNARKPESFISLNAKNTADIEALGHNTFRWRGH